MKKTDIYAYLKVFTTFLVVLAHATRMYTSAGAVQTVMHSDSLAYITEFIYSFHMPLFFVISGMVYGFCVDECGKYDDYKRFIFNKAKRILIPYFIIGFCFVVPVMVNLHISNDGYFRYALYGILLNNDSRHLWYLATLFGIFALVGIFGKKKDKNLTILLVMIVVHYAWNNTIGSKIPNLLFDVKSILFFDAFFYMGVILNRNSKLLFALKNPFLIICFFVFQVIITKYNIPCTDYVLRFSGSFMVIGICQWFSDGLRNNSFYKVLSKNGFGIYLFHPMIIYIIFYIFRSVKISPVLLTAFAVATSYVLSVCVSCLLRKVKLGFIIGE